jgi:hypothetical protein
MSFRSRAAEKSDAGNRSCDVTSWSSRGSDCVSGAASNGVNRKTRSGGNAAAGGSSGRGAAYGDAAASSAHHSGDHQINELAASEPDAVRE